MKHLIWFALLLSFACDNGGSYPSSYAPSRTVRHRVTTTTVVNDGVPIVPPAVMVVPSVSVAPSSMRAVSVPTQIERSSTRYDTETRVAPIVEQQNSNTAQKARSSFAVTPPTDNSFSSRANTTKDFTVRDAAKPKLQASGFGVVPTPAAPPPSRAWGSSTASGGSSKWGAPSSSAPAKASPAPAKSSWGSSTASGGSSKWGKK